MGMTKQDVEKAMLDHEARGLASLIPVSEKVFNLAITDRNVEQGAYGIQRGDHVNDGFYEDGKIVAVRTVGYDPIRYYVDPDLLADPTRGEAARKATLDAKRKAFGVDNGEG